VTLVVRRRGTVARFVRELIYGPDPIGSADVAQLRVLTFGPLQGGALGGPAHFGMKGDASTTFTGLVASPQQFVGQAQMGKTSAIVVQAYPALPNASPPPANRQWLQDWTQEEELLS
jgi:hypothetical protein